MRLIGCVYNDYEASGGLDDALRDTTGNIMVFDNEKQCVNFACDRGWSVDNLDIWDLDTLKCIGRWVCERSWNNAHKLEYFTFIKKE